jgi:amidase
MPQAPSGGAPEQLDAFVFQSATDAADMLRRGQVSSRELTELLLAQIDVVNPSLNAVVELRREEALEEALMADEQLADGDRGPLLGVPITIKEAFNVAGMHTTWGNPGFKDYVADSDATVVERLKRAGAIIVGKTNVHFMLADFAQTFNDVYGSTANPWDTARTPGGSSGGSAAAIAAGMSFLEFGSDLVGSIRIPASFCGVYGLRPSVGIVPLTGLQVPGSPSVPSEMSCMSAVGPFGRSVRDLRLALNVTAGPELPAANAYSWTLLGSRHARLEDFRVGVVLDAECAPVTSEVSAVLSDAVDALSRAGATVVEGWPEGVDPVVESESFGFHVQLFLALQEAGHYFTGASEFIEQENRRMAARAGWSRYFEDIDVFVCPANFTAAFPHDARPFGQRTITTSEGERPYDSQPFWISHASLPGLPAVVAPIGRTSGGLPVGVQIIGPLYEDDTALTFAEQLGGVVGGYEPPPV